MAPFNKKAKNALKQSKRGCVIVVRGAGEIEVQLKTSVIETGIVRKTKHGKVKAIQPASHLFMTESEEQRMRTQEEFLRKCASYRKILTTK